MVDVRFTALANELGQKANIASPTFTGIVEMPQTKITQTLTVLNDVSLNNNMFVAGDTSMNGSLNITNPILSENSTQVATTSFVKGQCYAQLSGASFTGNLSTTNDLVVSAIVWSACGAQTNLRINAAMMLQNTSFQDALATVDSADLSSGIIYQLKFRPCR